MADDAREVTPFRFIDVKNDLEEDEFDFRPRVLSVDPDLGDLAVPKDLSAQEPADSSLANPSGASEKNVPVEAASTISKASELGSQTSSQKTNPGKKKPPVEDEDQSTQATQTPGSQSEDNLI